MNEGGSAWFFADCLAGSEKAWCDILSLSRTADSVAALEYYPIN